MFKLAVIALVLVSGLSAQDKPAAPSDASVTKTFDVKYIDPEQVRDLFTDRSFVMDANRELKTLSVHGSPEFLKEVEDAIKRFDLPPAPIVNVQITVYLLTVAAQAPAAVALPPELAAIGKELGGTGAQVPRLADSQMVRVRLGEPAEMFGLSKTPETASLAKVRLQSAALVPGPKGELLSLNGLGVWLNIPSATPTPSDTVRPPKGDPDVSANIDVTQNQPAIVSRAGIDKPVVVVVRASVIH